MTRVVFLIIDGLPSRVVGDRVTPHLAALAARGARGDGRAVMTSATYPNHATFATGAGPEDHRLLANWVVDGAMPKPAQMVGPAVPTIFDVCRSAGRSSVCVVGDHNLIPVMGAGAAHDHWPPGGVLPTGTVQENHGYAADSETAPRIVAAIEGDADLVVGHLNEPDTAGHDLGPDSEEAAEAYHLTDAALGTVLDATQSRWDDTIVMVVSDHDMETVDIDAPPIDLYAPIAEQGLGLVAIPEGNGAVVWGEDATGGAWLDAVGGVAGHAPILPDARVVWGEVGRVFALPAGINIDPFRGQHGSATTRRQVAVVAGGHPSVHALCAALANGPIEATAWAPTMASLLGITLAAATGRSLV